MQPIQKVIEPPTIQDYWAAVGSYSTPMQEDFWEPLRPGQVAFNVLHAMRPDLSEQIRTTLLDPFYKQHIPTEFVDWLSEHWNDDILH